MVWAVGVRRAFMTETYCGKLALASIEGIITHDHLRDCGGFDRCMLLSTTRTE